jgi:hypothetical protein
LRETGDVARKKAPSIEEHERRYRELLSEIAEIGFVRSGSVAQRFNYCGTPSCRCHADPPQPHGPYWQWTAKVGGKTVNRRLSGREAERYLEWIGNDRKLRALIDELHEVAYKATNLILEAEAKV